MNILLNVHNKIVMFIQTLTRVLIYNVRIDEQENEI